MPSLAFHSNYWAGSADAPAAPASGRVPAYVTWMSNINVHSVAGSLGANVFQRLYEMWRPSVTTTQVTHGDH